MLRTLIIDPDLNRNVEHLLSAFESVQIIHAISYYPDPVQLVKMLDAEPELVLVSASSLKHCAETSARIEALAPEASVVAFGRNCDPDAVTAVLNRGAREFLAIPFHPAAVEATLSRHQTVPDCELVAA